MAQFNWTPGIGDPSLGGWLTVVLYFVAAFSCWKTAHALSRYHARGARELYVWWSICLLFVALGFNKQLDLQTAFTEIGRIVAENQGWYGERQTVQLAFIAGIAIACLIAATTMLSLIRTSPAPTWAAVVGTILVLGFVLMRAASFHHIDRFIGTRLLGLRWNWVLEMGGIIVVLLGSLWRQQLVNRQHPA